MSRVEILASDDRALTLDGALLMYRSRFGDVYATSHPIEIDAGSPNRRVIGAGVPVTKTALAEFARAVNVATAYAGFVPDNLLYTSPNMLAWWTPAAVRNSWFKSTSKEIGDAHGPVAHPALVFVATPGRWFVFALRKSARPDPSTALYHAPHFNVHAGGHICTGNVKLPPALSPEAISAYNDAFYRSHFTHPSREKAVKYKGGMQALWRDQLAAPNPDAMQRALVPAKETLQGAITRLTQSANHY